LIHSEHTAPFRIPKPSVGPRKTVPKKDRTNSTCNHYYVLLCEAPSTCFGPYRLSSGRSFTKEWCSYWSRQLSTYISGMSISTQQRDITPLQWIWQEWR